MTLIHPPDSDPSSPHSLALGGNLGSERDSVAPASRPAGSSRKRSSRGQSTVDSSSSALAIASDGLTKRFRGGQVAVDHVDLRVPVGSVYGFLGPNGSGKTTTIRMLLGLIFPTAGTHRLLGEPFADHAAQVLPRVGSLVEGPAFHPYLSGSANLARLDAADRSVDPRTARRRTGSALERVGLSAAAGKRYRNYSLGMRQRLGIAAALLRPRDLLVLDEPTNGLDPQGTREVRHLIRQLGDEGVTVFVSSHLLSEVEQVCSHVGVMSVGRMVWQGSLASLAEQQQVRVHVTTAAPPAAAEVLTGLGLDGVSTVDGGAVGVLGATQPEHVVEALVAAGVGVRAFTVERPSLEDVFVDLTGEGFDVSG
jgi:ABC-2 type transport system ATP-binding protein